MAVGDTGEDQLNNAEGSRLTPPAAPLRSAAMAAGLLESACAPGAGDPLRLEVIRALARDLAEELKAMAVTAHEEAAIEGALRAADLANLAASALPELPEARAAEAAATIHLAAGAARALCALAGAGLRDGQGEYARRNTLGDLQGAGWRARLAVRQADEFFEGED